MTPIFPAHTPDPTKQARTALAALTQNFMNTAKYLQSEANAGAADMRQTRALPDGAGIEAIVSPGTDLETSRKSIALAERYDMIYACVGFHPHDASKADAKALEEIEKLSDHPKVVGIGEIGLDYHYNFSAPERQKEVFALQIDIARRRNLPIVIHSREAGNDTLRIVEESMRAHAGWRSANAPRGVFHCFSGDSSMAKTVIGWNFFISIPGPVTFPAKPDRPNVMADVVAAVSLDHILLETDSPYLTPMPHRGKRNEPSYIPLIADVIAKIQNRPVGEVGASTSRGARRLFGLPEKQPSSPSS